MIIYHNPPPVWANVSPRNHAQYCPSTADRVVICVFKQGYTLGKISSLFKKDLEVIILRNNSHGGIIRVCMGIFTTALRNKKFVKFSIKIPHLPQFIRPLTLMKRTHFSELSISRFSTYIRKAQG